LKHYDLKVPFSSQSLPFVARLPEGAESDIALRLGRFPRHQVAAAIPDYLVRPNSPIAIDQLALDQAIKNLGASPPSMRCGAGCTVGILDSGVDPNDLVHATVLHRPQFDALTPLTAGSMLSDTIGHGSLVARIVNTVAPAAKLISIKTFGQTGTISNVIAGLYLAHAVRAIC
jgi:hypothetical protein